MDKRVFVLSFVWFVCSSSMVSAGEYPCIYKGIRPMGMGGAYTAISNDANALFYNPAGLSFVSAKRVSLLPVAVEMSRGGYSAYKDALDVDTDNVEETADFLRDYIGEYSHVAASVFPSYERPHFALGIFGIAKTSFITRNHQNPRLIVDGTADTGVAAGYAHAFFDDRLSVGASAKYVMRKSIDREYTLPEITGKDLEDRIEDDLIDGSGALLDIGLIYRIKDLRSQGGTYDIQLGLSVGNLIGSDMGDAKDLKEHVDVGFAALFDTWTFAVDVVDVSANFDEDDDYGKRVRLGIEHALNKWAFVRVGFYQGYPTYGISLDGRYAQMDFLSYAEEIGVYSGQRSDRRYVLRLGLGF